MYRSLQGSHAVFVKRAWVTHGDMIKICCILLGNFFFFEIDLSIVKCMGPQERERR